MFTNPVDKAFFVGFCMFGDLPNVEEISSPSGEVVTRDATKRPSMPKAGADGDSGALLVVVLRPSVPVARLD